MKNKGITIIGAGLLMLSMAASRMRPSTLNCWKLAWVRGRGMSLEMQAATAIKAKALQIKLMRWMRFMILNYDHQAKIDVKDILVSDLLKDSTEEKIEAFIADNLSQYDNLL